ncbi:hypothetical protein [Piscirickettsia litoralis]|uniref:MarR family transcriptional regulator n=1 Tax=Piscirickettsia litoralis TaxID=1891921 RepID=A0ABX2ZZ41_9GAMM|nr:hypothetical protein [Piscirickettsia litoralis]ODN41287.1 hypothetical protein BGC07_17125 [Piscirickettsia litoralis]
MNAKATAKKTLSGSPIKTDIRDEAADKNRTQTVHKVDTNRTQEITESPDVSLLVGIQKEIFMFIYKQTLYHKDRVTRPLTLVEIAEKVGCKMGAVKTSVARLKGKKLYRET